MIKSVENEKTNLYYISGHSASRFQSGSRYKVPEKICIYTLVETGFGLEQKMFQLFNLGLNGDSFSSNKLKKISFDERNNKDINVELNLLEKKIYTNGLYKLINIKEVNSCFTKNEGVTYTIDNYSTSDGIPYRSINSAIIYYLYHTKPDLIEEDFFYDNYLKVMNMPVIDIIKFILEKLKINRDRKEKYSLEEIYKIFYKGFKSNVHDEYTFRNSTILSDLILKFINKEETEYLDERFTYFNLFKKIYNLSLRRYFVNQEIYNYSISIDLPNNVIRGLLAAPYPVNKEHSGLELDLYKHFSWNFRSIGLSTIINSFIKENSQIQEEYNVFILGICNVIDGIKVIQHDDDNYIYNTIPEESKELKLARENSFNNYFSKYIKYKKKYLDLKNFKSIKLFGGTITESDERLLNILEIDKNLIYDLKMVDADYRDVVKNLINKNIEKHKENRNPLKVFKDNHNEIIFISKQNNFKKSLEEFRDYLIKYNYFDNILKVVEIKQKFTITKENIIADIDDKVDDIDITIIKKINVNDIFGLLEKDGPDIFRINKLKPVATLLSKISSTFIWSTFRENYNSYTPEEKSKLNEILLSRDIKLYGNGYGSQFIFYSENYLLRLCRIFNIDLDKALNILSIIGNIKTDDEMYFIYCAFHNGPDIEAIIRLHKENKINIELYERFINE